MYLLNPVSNTALWNKVLSPFFQIFLFLWFPLKPVPVKMSFKISSALLCDLCVTACPKTEYSMLLHTDSISNDLSRHILIWSDKSVKVLYTQIRDYCSTVSRQLWGGGWSVWSFLVGARQGRNEGDSWDEEGASAHCQEKKAGLQQDTFIQSQSKKARSVIKICHWKTVPQVYVLKYLWVLDVRDYVFFKLVHCWSSLFWVSCHCFCS